VVGNDLILGLQEVNEVRPRDPIAYLACCLYNYHYKTDHPKEKQQQNEIPEFPFGNPDSNPGSGGSSHSTIAMQTAKENTGIPVQLTTNNNNNNNIITQNQTSDGAHLDKPK
ncbi:unnamed protein product, partial [Meganyctiphanes norvegica]